MPPSEKQCIHLSWGALWNSLDTHAKWSYGFVQLHKSQQDDRGLVVRYTFGGGHSGHDGSKEEEMNPPTTPLSLIDGLPSYHLYDQEVSIKRTQEV